MKEWFLKLFGSMTESLKVWAVRFIVQAESSLPGATAAEKRTYVVKMLDEKVDLPWYAEPFDGPLFGLLVDLACKKLNLLTDHNLTAVPLTEVSVNKAAALLEVDDDKIKSVSTLSIDERIEALYRKYGIK